MTHPHTLEGFHDAVASAKTGADLDALELQMIAIGHAPDGALRGFVAERRRALKAEPGGDVVMAHRGQLLARAEMAERLAHDPDLFGAEHAAALKRAKHPDADVVAERHAEATAVARKHYAAAAKAARTALGGR